MYDENNSSNQYGAGQYSTYQYNNQNTANGNTAGNRYGQNNSQAYGSEPKDSTMNMAPKPPKKKKEGTGFGKKAVMSVCLGLFFGVCAALGFQAVTTTVEALKTELGTTEQSAISQDVITEEPAAEDAQTEVTDNSIAQTASDSLADSDVTQSQSTMDVTQIVQEVLPSVVAVNSKVVSTVSYFGQSMQSEGTSSGSGIIVGENEGELLLVTNYHVIEDSQEISVQFADDTEATALLKGTDSDMDLAVIAVALEDLSSDTRNAITVATLGDSDQLQVGEPAIAIGNALGYGQSVTTGVISALNRPVAVSSYSDGQSTDTEATFIQTDAAINPGNSGGALINMQGEVIGINSSKIGGDTIDSIGYAIPISAAEPIIEELMSKTTKVRVEDAAQGYIGISGITVSSDYAQAYNMPEGVYVSQVMEGGAAEAAGLQAGDIITDFDGDMIRSMEELKEELTYYACGTTVELTIQRMSDGGYKETTATITLGEKVVETQ